MYTILLSGGSGKRLWPLSSSTRSKQYIRFLVDEKTGKPCSMVQRMWNQLEKAEMIEDCVICASKHQSEILRSQIGNVNIAVEPEARDTFSAVALSCLYMKSKMHASDNDIVCIVPVDPFTDQSYFETLKHMPKILNASNSEIVLMGIKPAFPSGNFGYILPGHAEERFLRVEGFVEKPDPNEAKKLIEQGALWNGGVFCLRIRTVLGKLAAHRIPCDYDSLYHEYSKLPQISFDYAVVEKCDNLAAVTYSGTWKDIGTWSAVSDVMKQPVQSNCVIDPSCQNVTVINETNIPVAAIGVNNLIVVASTDGILVEGFHSGADLKKIVSFLSPRPVFEEKSWGTVAVLDYFNENGIGYLVKKLCIDANKGFFNQCENVEGSVSVLKGSGRITIRGKEYDLVPGGCMYIPTEEPYSLFAEKDGLILTFSQKGACEALQF